LGTAIALPMLEAMLPASSRAAGAVHAAKLPPKRMAFVFMPNGINMADWTPKQTGSSFELPYLLEPLAPVKDELLVLSGLAHDKARPNGDGPGDHARASATYLTGCQARKTQGADIRVGVSVDQVAAPQLGQATRLGSLELGCDYAQLAGNCDSGYSCAYSFNISWRTASTPMPPEVDPRLVFERLFGSGSAVERAAHRARRQHAQHSILDYVREDAQRLQAQLGATDRRKLDEYLMAVRELEQRLDRAQPFEAATPAFDRPAGIPKDYAEHVRLMYDLMALAFQTDSTRVATFMVAHDGSNRSYPFIGVSDGHHDLSHHGNNPEKQKKVARINRFHLEHFARFLIKLKSIREGEGTLLDRCMIVCGSGIGDGNAHNHDNLPVLLCGRGGGSLRTGRHIRFDKETPMTNLYLSMLERAGVSVERLGDSTGKLAGLG
jgi:hypothetical protein